MKLQPTDSHCGRYDVKFLRLKLDKKKTKYQINSNLENKLKTLVCRTFQNNNKLRNKYISILNDNNGILTEDKRHIKLDKLVLTDLVNYCKF